MTRLERNADLAVGLESTNSRAMASARIDNHEGTTRRIDDGALRRDDAHEAVIDWSVEAATIHH